MTTTIYHLRCYTCGNTGYVKVVMDDDGGWSDWHVGFTGHVRLARPKLDSFMCAACWGRDIVPGDVVYTGPTLENTGMQLTGINGTPAKTPEERPCDITHDKIPSHE